MKNQLFLLFFWIIAGNILMAQTMVQPQSPAQTFIIKGTSTLHDWEMKATQIFGSMSVVNEGGTLKSIPNVKIKVPVSSLKSDKSTMDSKTYEALKKDKFPNITYESTEITLIPSDKADLWFCKSTGIMNVAGTPRKKTISGSIKKLPDGRYHAMTTIYITMTEFGVEPPVMFLGTLKTGDKVTVTIEVFFK